ncbi:MAG: hypothetical protein ACRDLL_06340 [Solirubrobacterales bacterium]
MNMLKKGPELKMPDLKVPDFLLDLYYDLRERHLLPLVGILLIAIVALPVVLSSSDSEIEEPVTPATSPSASLPSSKLVVAKAAPGLREYRKRLAGTPKDPFIQQYTEEEGESANEVGANVSSLSAESSPSGGAESFPEGSESSSPETAPSETAPAAPPSEGGGSGEPSQGEQLRYYSFAIDVRIVPVNPNSGASKAKPSVRNNLPELTMLPSRKEPALTFMDVSKDEKKVLMLVSDKVTGLFGDGVCIVGSEHCQLLALEKGIPETVVYGPQERTFRIELRKLRLLTTDKLHKAPLSKPKGKGGDKQPEEQPAG